MSSFFVIHQPWIYFTILSPKIKTFFLLLLTTSFPTWFSFVLFSVLLTLLVSSTIISVVLMPLSTILFFYNFAVIVVIHIFMAADYQLICRMTRRTDDVVYWNFCIRNSIETYHETQNCFDFYCFYCRSGIPGLESQVKKPSYGLYVIKPR